MTTTSKESIHAAWCRTHPVQWYFCLVCVALTLMTMLADFHLLAKEGRPELGKYAGAIVAASAILLMQKLQKRNKQTDALPPK